MQSWLPSALAHAADGAGLSVAIFDTWPAMWDPALPLGAAITEPLAAFAQFQPIAITATTVATPLGVVQHGVRLSGTGIYHYVDISPDGIDCTRDDVAGNPIDAYDEVDHGVFVAGIVGQIAPNAPLSIYRVLTDEGIGSLEMIAKAVEAAVQRLSRDPGGAPLVLNLSLGFAPQLPLLTPLLANIRAIYNMPGFWRAIVTRLAPAGAAIDPAATLKDLAGAGHFDAEAGRFSGVLGVIDFVFAFDQSPSVLAIAAAGNDSRAGGPVYGPRLPAALNGVLGVSSYVAGPATGLAAFGWTMSSFSNSDDFLPGNDGIGALGGEVKGRDTIPEVSVIGPYVSAQIPPGSGSANNNTTGMAVWAGTSFSTPIVAGLAAALWSEALSLASFDIRALLTSGDQPGPDQEYIALTQA